MHIRIPVQVKRLGGMIVAACSGADIVLGMVAGLHGNGATAWSLLSIGGTALGILTWEVVK